MPAENEAPPDDDSWLVHQWVVAGIVSASSRFIPIPLIDDIVRDQCRRYVVSKTLAAHDQKSQLSQWKPYYASHGGCATGCLGLLARVPLRILLFPVRKLIVIFTSIRGVPLEVLRTVLLGRTLDRCLKQDVVEPKDAERMKIAFEEAFSRMDFRTVKAGINDAVQSVSNWKSAAIGLARKVARERQEPGTTIETPSAVENSAENVQEVLRSPETLELLKEFDRRFDEHFHPPA